MYLYRRPSVRAVSSLRTGYRFSFSLSCLNPSHSSLHPRAACSLVRANDTCSLIGALSSARAVPPRRRGRGILGGDCVSVIRVPDWGFCPTRNAEISARAPRASVRQTDAHQRAINRSRSRIHVGPRSRRTIHFASHAFGPCSAEHRPPGLCPRLRTFPQTQVASRRVGSRC